MKQVILLIGLILFALPGFTQEKQKSRKEVRAEREALKIKEIASLLGSKNYVFNATHALPMGGTSIFLTSSYDLKILGDSAIAYLPFYGVAYQAEYGGRNGGIEFSEPVIDYSIEKSKYGKLIKFEVKTPKDIYRINLSVSQTGNANLQVNCNNRQPMQFFGRIEGEK